MAQNLLGEASEEECIHAATYITAKRFDVRLSEPLAGEPVEAHRAFLIAFRQLRMDGLHGFPLWEKEVHDTMHAHFSELVSIFRAYCTSLGEGVGDAAAATMSADEFHDLVVDTGLETTLQTNPAAAPATYTWEKMQFDVANKSGTGRAGPAADGELQLHEFLSVLLRVAFHRLNPGACFPTCTCCMQYVGPAS